MKGFKEALEKTMKEFSEDTAPKPMTADCARKSGGFEPIKGLKKGDKVKYKSEGLRTTRVPTLEQVIEVYRVIENPIIERNEGMTVIRDFTSLFKYADGNILEYFFESRRFKKVDHLKKMA